LSPLPQRKEEKIPSLSSLSESQKNFPARGELENNDGCFVLDADFPVEDGEERDLPVEFGEEYNDDSSFIGMSQYAEVAEEALSTDCALVTAGLLGDERLGLKDTFS
jgi:hypothetical protein